MNQTQQYNLETYVGTESLTEDDYHRLMAVRRRRTTLSVLAVLSVPIDLEDLAEAVVKWEENEAAIDETSIDQIEIELHHIHLPKMDNLDVIDYDRDNNRVVAWS
ncbi:hypothetical protein SAMN05216388_100971 [Halorientalis persicus]|uniref:DUF7344 domain-containing protein n=1 Tax=Halorientalis persicus TaxID=1367881 RepID=A0A1H8MP66_9EURY|nr:hypothetical protein [Halorientalis persicus]SEO19137.1 hypothetical protein SAMN05216388_100971 [Halorientalis persicus]